MDMNTRELLKEYKQELNLEEKIKYNDYEGIVRALMLRAILVTEHNLSEEEYNEIYKNEAYVFSIQDKLLAQYPQLRTTIEEIRLKIAEIGLKKVA